MITWIIYSIVGLILIFVLYIAILGISRGVAAKTKNKANSVKKRRKFQIPILIELEKLKNFNYVAIDKVQNQRIKKTFTLT